MSDDNALLHISPDEEKRPILPPGVYDKDANLERLERKKSPFRDATVISMQVVVRHPDLGFVRMFRDIDLGPTAKKILLQLGFTEQQIREGVTKEGLASVLPMPVTVEVAVKDYVKKDEVGNEEAMVKNVIVNVHKLV